jgi:hypothetical protein
LGGEYSGIADQAQQLIAPLGKYAVRNYFVIEPNQRPTDPKLFQP